MKFKKSCIIIILICLIIFIFSGMIFANYKTFVPFNDYFYNFWGEPVPAPQSYIPTERISGNQLEIGDFHEPRDLFVYDENNVYILDSGNNRIIHLDNDFKLKRIIKDFNNNGQSDSFNNPQGIFVTPDKHIFITDTNNSRIVELNEKGEFLREIGPPDSEHILRRDFEYYPLKIAVDEFDRIYVNARHVYEGLLYFNYNGDFQGFVGAPGVDPSPIDLFWRTFSTEEQRKRQRLFLPTEFTNVDISSDGFILTTVARRDEEDPIRKLNPSGTDVLQRVGFHDPQGDLVEEEDLEEASISGGSQLVDISDSNNVYSVLDRRRSRIFTYNHNGRLLYVFGGRGRTKGTFLSPVALEYYEDDKLLVLDRDTGYLTMFSPTEYSKNIIQAIDYYNDGRYERATNKWRTVLNQNTNYELAYIGIGRSYLEDGEIDKALNYFKNGNDRINYSQAYSFYRRELLVQNFNFLLYILLMMIVVLYVLYKFKPIDKLTSKMENIEATDKSPDYNVNNTNLNRFLRSILSYLFKLIEFIKEAFYVVFHPFDGFWELKEKKKANYCSSGIIILLVALTYIFLQRYTGFILNERDLSKFNLFVEAISVFVPIILWSSVNWAATTLMDGKGNFNDILNTTAYSLIPIIIINFPVTIMSNYMTLEEANFYYLFITFSVIWSLALLFFGTMTIHDYDLFKNIVAIICILVGIGGVIFVAFLFFDVLDRLYLFITEIFTELIYRI